MLRSVFLSSLFGRTKKVVGTCLAEGLCPLPCPGGPADELVSEFKFSHVSGWALQKLDICDSSFACSDKPLTCPDRSLSKFARTCFPPHFLAQSSSLTPFSLISLGFWPKTLDPSRLKPPISNPTPETWSSRQDLCFHQFVWDKSKNSSFSRFRVNLESLSLIF